MRARWLILWAPTLLALSACSPDAGTGPGPGRDGGRTDARPGEGGVPDAARGPCVDGDHDGIADNLEGSADLDRDGIPNAMDDDSDGDGFLDRDEAVGNYPGFSANRDPLVCGQSAFNCDGDDLTNDQDLDSDNDGLTDAEELAAHTNPCAEDTDGDMVTDLVEHVAMTDPTNAMSMPPTSSLYVTLPYHPPGEVGEHPQRTFRFSTRLRAADIFFLVDTTGSMQTTIDNVRNTLTSTIIPGIVMALGVGADARYGMGGHGDFDQFGPNYTGNIQIFSRLDPNPMRAQAGAAMLRADNGNDYPESQVPAMHALISGHGEAHYAGSGSVHTGQATRDVDPVGDCGASPDDVVPYGWGCFRPDRVPIIVLFSDAEWHNRMGVGNEYTMTPGAGTYDQLVAEMTRRGAYFVGIDVGGGDTHRNSVRLAADTHTLDGAGRAIAFQGPASGVAAQVISAIGTIAGSSRQDITTRTDPDRTDTRLAMPHTTADFVRAVNATRGYPDPPTGYDRHDDTTFFNVAPSTEVEFTADFYNDFQPGAATAQLFRATIVVLGRAGAPVDRREVYIIVPATGGGEPG